MISSVAWQLAFSVIAMLIVLSLALGTKRTVSIGVLLVLIPFQIIDSQYASSSVLFAYTLAAVLMISGRFRLRMMPLLVTIVLAYCASLALADRDMLQYHVVYMFQLFSCLVVFLIAYNFAVLVENERAVMNVLLVMNAMVIGYCVLQFTVGPGERMVPFGIEQFRFNANRDPSDPRLVGPFGNPGTTAGYFWLMTVVCAVDFIFARDRRRLAVCLLAGFNLLGLVATGNRTGFLVLLALFIAFLFIYRGELGGRRVAQYLIGGLAILAVTATVAVAFTDFDVMFRRLTRVTEVEAGVPATRQETWPVAFAKIRKDPWFGEGPYFWTAEDAEKYGQIRAEFDELGELETAFDPFPHSLYLYLLRTVGIFGLVAVTGFFIQAWFVMSKALRIEPTGYRSAIIRLGILLIPAFLVSQITLEFIRRGTMDYGQFIFAFVGLLVGTSDRILRPGTGATLTPRSHPGGKVGSPRIDAPYG